MSAPIIEAQVSRWYGLVMGLNHISFDILPGITGWWAPMEPRHPDPDHYGPTQTQLRC